MLAVTDWLLLIGVCALGAMTPGASLAVVTRHTLRGSARGRLWRCRPPSGLERRVASSTSPASRNQ